MIGVSRFTRGWIVRLHYENNLPKYTKTFNDSDYNGKEGSLKAAKKYRDNILNLMKTLGDFKRPYSRRKAQKNNKLGILGVYLNKDTAYRAAFTTDDNVVKNLSFSINKFGDDIALQLAILSRKLLRRATMEDLGINDKKVKNEKII